MSRTSDAIRRGHYAAKQIHCPDPLIAWSHSRRFQLALQLADEYLPPDGRVLDHGCGDGTFLALLVGDDGNDLSGVGTEITEDLVTDCRTRFDGIGSLRFIFRDDLVGPEHREAYDLVTCMEVLEHVVAIEEEIELLSGLVKPGGVLLVSVPVETGLPLLVKQALRRIAGWRGLGDYPGDSPYTAGQLVRGVFAGSRQHIERPTYPTGPGLPPHYTHKGFNWMALRRRLAKRFDIERVLASPIPGLPPHLNSQAWFVARKRKSA